MSQIKLLNTDVKRSNELHDITTCGSCANSQVRICRMHNVVIEPHHIGCIHHTPVVYSKPPGKFVQMIE